MLVERRAVKFNLVCMEKSADQETEEVCKNWGIQESLEQEALRVRGLELSEVSHEGSGLVHCSPCHYAPRLSGFLKVCPPIPGLWITLSLCHQDIEKKHSEIGVLCLKTTVE